jgi:hypothetical protein
MKEFIPKRSNSLSKQVIMGLFIISLVAMFSSTIPNLPFHSLMQLFALITLAVAIALLGRYEFKTYAYEITKNGEDEYDLTVTEIKRRSRITVCRISLSSISELHDISRENKSNLKELRAGRKSFNYCVDIAPPRTCCIVTNEGGEETVIYLSFIPELFEMLNAMR